MKFASLSHLIDEKTRESIPKTFFHDDLIISPELNIRETKGYIIALNLTAKQIMKLPRENIRAKILNAALFAQEELNVELIQLGALTTSVTEGGKWIVDQPGFKGFINHGDSYTAAITCQTVIKILKDFNKDPSEAVLAIVGAYGIIGEAVSKILVPKFYKSILIGRRMDKLKDLESSLKGNFETSTNMITKDADVIVTATSHPEALLESENMKKNAIIVDVSQPPNLSREMCQKRPDIFRIDGGYVEFPLESPIPIPGMPVGKNFACFAEVIMQAMENERNNHVGTVDMNHLEKTEKWGNKYGFILKELTNFGEKIG